MSDSDRNIILLPIGGAPRVVAADRSIFDQACKFAKADSVSQIPCSLWMADKFRVALAAPAVVGTDRNANALASKVFGSPVHGDCILCRRPEKDEDMYGLPHRSDRYLRPFDSDTASSVLAALGKTIEDMHHE